MLNPQNHAPSGRIFQINASRGGVPKRPLAQATVTHNGLASDAQNDRVHHGGPQRALCLYSLEQIHALQAEGHPIFPGAAGENLTLAGLNWDELTPGRELQLGDEVRIQLTAYAVPCSTIAPFFRDAAFTRLSQKLHPGWSRIYARVLTGGILRAGDGVTVCS